MQHFNKFKVKGRISVKNRLGSDDKQTDFQRQKNRIKKQANRTWSKPDYGHTNTKALVVMTEIVCAEFRCVQLVIRGS